MLIRMAVVPVLMKPTLVRSDAVMDIRRSPGSRSATENTTHVTELGKATGKVMLGVLVVETAVAACTSVPLIYLYPVPPANRLLT